jgi:hypothetical protein
MFTYLCVLIAAAAFAEDVQEEAPKYLLADLGVRVDLPDGWNVTRWSDWDLKAETSTPGVLLFVWSTPFQVEPSEENIDAWGAIAKSKMREINGKAAKVSEASIGSLQGQAVALSSVSFHFDSETGPMGWLYGASIPIEGQMFHLATVATARRKRRAEGKREELLQRLDIRAKGAELAWGAQVSADGIQTILPKDWRPVLELEKSFLAAEYKLLGVAEPDACWTAVRPHPTEDPSVMVTCPGSLWVGVVDEHSFEGVDKEIRKGLFGAASVAAARKLELGERFGFIYQPPLGDRQFVVGAVPYAKGIGRTWALGPAGSEPLSASLEQTLRASSYEGEHPAGAMDYITYAFKYRLLLALIPVGLLSALILGGLRLLFSMRRKNSYDDISEMIDKVG